MINLTRDLALLELDEQIRAQYWRNPTPNRVVLARLWAEFDHYIREVPGE